ncbi:MAG: hypothetical protein INQ03_09350 [Candidatus Heimdallarchaeota archaeon]|nr:hypothetical protein [Candidatus Heimdallarchaeota archaeon]
MDPLLRLPLYEARRGYTNRLGQYNQFEIDLFVRDSVLAYILDQPVQGDEYELGKLDMEIRMHAPDYKDIKANLYIHETIEKKAIEWNDKAARAFFKIQNRLGQVLIAREFAIFPFENYINPVDILPTEYVMEHFVTAIYGMRVSFDLNKQIFYKLWYIIFQLFNFDHLPYSALLEIKIIKDGQLLAQKNFYKEVTNLDEIFVKKFNEFISSSRVSKIIENQLYDRYPMLIMSKRELRYYMKIFKGEPLFFRAEGDFTRFINDLREDELVNEIYYSSNDTDTTSWNLLVETDPTKVLVKKYGQYKVWDFQIALAEIVINYLDSFNLFTHVSFSGNRSVHVHANIKYTQPQAEEFYEWFFALIDYKNITRDPIVDNYRNAPGITMLIANAIGIKIRNELNFLVKQVFNLHILRYHMTEKYTRELAIGFDATPNKYRGQYRTLMSIHSKTKLLKIPFEMERTNRLRIVNKYRNIDYVRYYSTMYYWTEDRLDELADVLLIPMKEEKTEETLELLKSVMPEIFAVLKLGNKEIDYMDDEQLHELIRDSEKVLEELGIEFTRVPFELDWLTSLMDLIP